MQNDNEKNILLGKLNAFSAILRLGHEAFEKRGMTELAMHIVNNSRMAIPFSRSALVDLSTAKCNILALTSQVDINQNSEYCTGLKKKKKNIKFDSAQPIKLDAEFLEKQNSACKEAYKQVNPDNGSLFLIPLLPPRAAKDCPDKMLWLVEFNPPTKSQPIPLLMLLGKHYAEAIWSLQGQNKNYIKKVFRRKITPAAWFLGILLIFVLSLFTIRVRQDVAADFSIRPEHEISTFAWYDGIIKDCPFEDGSKVKKGDVILRYDTRRLEYRLASAKAEFNQAKAEFEKVSSEAFTQKQQLGNIKLLQIKKQKAQVAIKECLWLLSKSELRAPKDGILSLTAGNAEKLKGKAVKLGEKLFEIFSGDDLQAEIELDEKDSSIIEENPEVTLYLHSMPEVPIKGKIVFASSKPVLSPRNSFCYLLNTKLELRDKASLRYGMRGTARLYGNKVFLGYYLFRNLVLWWRNL